MQRTVPKSAGFSAGIVALLLGACAGSPTSPDDPLDAVRRMTAPFNNLDVARAAGYGVWSPDPMAANATCPSSAEGRMGYHLVNTALRGSPADPANGDAIIDPDRPEMLLFEKRADGSLRLVGVEYLVFRAAWDRANTSGSVPTVFGQPLLASRHAFVDGGPEVDHYELHVWLHSANPNGMFSPWNPAIAC
jgi:hypothetical protein